MIRKIQQTLWQKALDAGQWLHGFQWLSRILSVTCVAVLVVLALDREPPYRLLYIDPAVGRAGGEVLFVSHVWRDPHRNCSSTLSRALIDKRGGVKQLGVFETSDEWIDKEEAAHPGLAFARVDIPPNWPPGPAVMRTVLLYRCNITHALMPIEITVDRPFQVLP